MSSAKHHCIDYIEFCVADFGQLSAARNFYQAVFGWEYQEWAPTYVDTHGSGITSGISVGGDERHSPLPVVYADDLEAARANVLSKGGRITLEIFAFPGGRRFHFADPAGNEIGVWSDH